MTPILRTAWKICASATMLVLAAGLDSASAQDAGGTEPGVVGAPRNILPQFSTEEPASDESASTIVPSPPESRVPGRGGAAIVIGDLGTVEGPVAGTLGDADGGLGYDAWQRSDRAMVETMLESVPASTPSAAARLLMRKMLLTIAPPPPGRADKSFNALRLTRLMDGGFINDAADLAVTMRAPTNMEIVRAQADALVYAGRDADICSDVTGTRFESAEPFWAELRAYCYAATGDAAALELNRAVIEDQGLADPSFLTLLDGITTGKPTAPEVVRIPDSVHLLMMTRLKIPLTREMATALGMPATLLTVASKETPAELRIAAAERALRAGALPTPRLVEILELSSFMPSELIGAPALARTEPLMRALARLHAALAVVSEPVARADFIHTAFQLGEREGVLAQVAELFADDAAAIVPQPDWGNWSNLMIRGLLLAGRTDAAARWYDILDRDAEGSADTVDQLELMLVLAGSSSADPLTTSTNLLRLAERANPPAPEPPPEVLGPDGVPLSPAPAPEPPPKPPQPVIARATLDLGLFDALGRPMPDQARDAVEVVMAQPSAGRRPAPALMQRIDRAALAGSRGDVALGVAVALGAQGAGDLAPDVAVRLVRALRTAGIGDAAQALALEALLLRPAGG